ncbi:hypothetical protein BDY19DRAFT_301440 [Irpex rosettiformis]|uniref:Uncharacterized protein n=1 Tax=Irpex rosettiformis TaxID=378272 RepID=A0ACB8TYE3_9APHY|nr:hypothetical protein BDY19DRAFT_301440 [Irpex rosettiformis]
MCLTIRAMATSHPTQVPHHLLKQLPLKGNPVPSSGYVLADDLNCQISPTRTERRTNRRDAEARLTRLQYQSIELPVNKITYHSYANTTLPTRYHGTDAHVFFSAMHEPQNLVHRVVIQKVFRTNTPIGQLWRRILCASLLKRKGKRDGHAEQEKTR